MSLVSGVSALATRVAQECGAIWSALAGKADTSALAAVALSGDFSDLAGLQDVLDDKEEQGTAAAAVATHEADSDPHPQYLTTAEATAAYAALSHVHSGAAITSGTVAYARLPVGTTASTIAAGNDSRLTDARTPLAHVHAGGDITTGTVPFARLPAGTTSSTVAIGDHTHEGLGEGGGGFASGIIPSGSTQPVVEHGLGTQDLIIAVREVSTGLVVHVPVETVDASGTADDNKIRFTFTTAPTASQYRYTVLSAAATLGTGAHTHDIDDVTGLEDALDERSLVGHSHVLADVTGLQDALDDKAAVGHNHDGTYLTPAQGDADYAAIDHTHSLGSLGAAAASHTHAAGDINTGTLAIGRIPTGSTGSTVALGNHNHDSAYAALVHASRHATGGADPITPAAIGASATGHAHAGADITTGTVAFARLPTGTSSSTVAVGNDSRFTDARTPTAHAASHATGGGDAITASSIGALDQTAGDARYRQHNQAVRTASASTTYSLDGTLAGDVELTCTGNTTITPTGTPGGRTIVVTCLASGGARTPVIASAVTLTGGVTDRSLVIPSGGIGRFVLRYTALGSVGWSLDSAYLVG